MILLLAVSVQAQSVADAARKERERRASLKPTATIRAEGVPPAAPVAESARAGEAKKPEEGKADAPKPADTAASDKAKEAPKPQVPKVDPNKEWNDQVDKLRAKLSSLQDDERTLQLQINELNNQIYAPVVDLGAKDQAVARVGEIQQRLAAVRLDSDQTKKTLDAMQLQGPPKK